MKASNVFQCYLSWKIDCMVTYMDYIYGHSQRVAVNSSMSNWRPVMSGVPQGWYWDQRCSTSLSVTWAVGPSARSLFADNTKLCGAVNTLVEGITSRGTWTGLRGGPAQTSWSSTRPSARSRTWVRAIPSTNTGWGENGLRAAQRRRTWGCWVTRSSTWPGSTCSQPRRPTVC